MIFGKRLSVLKIPFRAQAPDTVMLVSAQYVILRIAKPEADRAA
jgi:hypothetical protein